jgi:hypothetical protein
VYRWELDGPAQQEFADLPPAARASLAAFMDAVVIVDPVQYQRRRDERDDVSMPLRSLHFGPDGAGLVTFLVYPPDDLVLVVKIQWLGGQNRSVLLGRPYAVRRGHALIGRAAAVTWVRAPPAPPAVFSVRSAIAVDRCRW